MNDASTRTLPAAGSAGAEAPRRTGGGLHRFANPGRFLRLSGRVLPWLTAAALVVLAIGLPWALIFSPADWQQGETVRLLYIHVPMAWLAMGGYLGLAIASAVALIWRHPLADLACRELSPVGAAVTALCLATGSLWGKPMWGTWWVWDARLTSVLVLFFLWLGHAALVRAFDDTERGARMGAILALIGAVNLPIVKFSVGGDGAAHPGLAGGCGAARGGRVMRRATGSGVRSMRRATGSGVRSMRRATGSGVRSMRWDALGATAA